MYSENTSSPQERLFTPADVSEMTSIPKTQLKNHIKSGTLQSSQGGNLYSPRDIEKLMSTEAAAETLGEWQRDEEDFIENCGTAAVGKIQLCTYADVYCSEDEAALLQDRLLRAVSRGAFPRLGANRVTVEHKNKKARVTILGGLEFTQALLSVLRE